MLPTWIEEKYVSLLSPSLNGFKVKKDHRVWNFNCPLCTDIRKRGYIYRNKKGILKFHCHNCSVNLRFENFLRGQNSALYYEYRKELLLASKDQTKVEVKEKKAEPVFDIFKKLKPIANLPADHPAREYVQKRYIPEKHFSRLFYAPKFRQFVNSVVPEKFSEAALKHDEPRLVIPCVNLDGSILGFTGRSFDPKAELRYISISLGTDRLIFGLDQADLSKHCYVVEGPIDSLFLPNCIAAGGSTIRQVMDKNRTAIFDNEPRNEQICNLMELAINEGMKIVIWPPYLKGKDINDLIKNGKTAEEVVGIISNNSYDGLAAKVKFSEWKRT